MHYNKRNLPTLFEINQAYILCLSNSTLFCMCLSCNSTKIYNNINNNIVIIIKILKQRLWHRQKYIFMNQTKHGYTRPNVKKKII